MSNVIHMPFSPSALQKAVEAELIKAVPEGQNGALVAVATAQGVKVAIAARLPAGWEVLGVLEKPYEGALTGSAMVVRKW
jgi:hypothetical protein